MGPQTALWVPFVRPVGRKEAPECAGSEPLVVRLKHDEYNQERQPGRQPGSKAGNQETRQATRQAGLQITRQPGGQAGKQADR